MGVQLRNVGFNRDQNAPKIKRSTGVLSDGSSVVLIGDQNQTGVTGDGGDGTGVPKLYLFHSSDRITWTLKNTISITVPGHLIASMVVDASNNVHLTWCASTGGITYKRLVYSAGPTWTADADSIVVGAPSGAPSNYYTYVDIDTLGTSTSLVAVAGFLNTVTATRRQDIKAFVRNASSTWVAQTSIGVVVGDSMMGWADDMSLAADQQAIGGDNIALFAVHAVRAGATYSQDFGDVIWMVKTNVSTGATQTVSTAFGPFNTGRGTAVRRKYWLFSSGNDKWVLAGISGTSPWESCVLAFTWNRTTNTRTLPDDIPMRYGRHGTVIYSPYQHEWCTVQFNKADKRVCIFGLGTNNLAYTATVILDYTNKTTYPQPGASWWDNQDRWGGVVPPTGLWGGGQSRNTHGGALDVIHFFWKYGATLAYRLYVYSKKTVLAPTNILPANNALLITDRPVLSGDHKLNETLGTVQYKLEWTIATDAGFTTNVRTVIEPNTDYVNALWTLTGNIIRATQAVGAIEELFQDTWYIRCRTLDSYGGVGPWSATQTFTVAHPPVPANLMPTANKVLVLDASNLITMTWTFTDPSPNDSQTAYQIVVEDNEDETSVLDTGKVTSTITKGTVTLAAGDKDKILRWRVRLWDTDDVPGPYSDNQLFIVTDPPEPVITSITEGGTVADGTPVVTWDPGLSAIQTQISYNLLVTQGALVLHNTGWLFGANTSYQIPLGVLHNSSQYTITLRVRDNFALDGYTTVSFTTVWTPPATPTGLQIYLAEFANRGFVYIVQDILEVDTDVIQYNLYRRRYGTAEWILINVWQDFIQEYLIYRDYLVGSGELYQYTVTQVIDSFGDIMESAITAEQIYDITPLSDRYWLLDSSDVEVDSLPLYSVTAESFTDEYEQESYHIIGRGRHTDIGDRFGYTGQLSCQLRDQVGHGVEHTNHVLNPAMEIISAGASVPDRWEVVQSGGTVDYFSGTGIPQDPSPTGKLLVPEIFVIGMPNASIIQLQQKLELTELPPAVASDTITFSVWVYDTLPLGASTQWRLDIAVLNAAETVLASSGSQTLSPVETYTSSVFGSPDYLNPSVPVTGIWKRLTLSVAWPSSGTPAKLRYAVGARNNTGGVVTNGFRVTGAQVEIGTLKPYLDGDQFGGLWLGEPGLAPSYTNGYYTGRIQRLNLETMKSRKSSVYIRTPFGDLFKSSTGNISVTRIPGTGITEFTDIEIPYMEVGA